MSVTKPYVLAEFSLGKCPPPQMKPWLMPYNASGRCLSIQFEWTYIVTRC